MFFVTSFCLKFLHDFWMCILTLPSKISLKFVKSETSKQSNLSSLIFLKVPPELITLMLYF